MNFSLKNDEFCIKCDELCVKTAGSAAIVEGAWMPAGKRWQEIYRVRSSSVCQEFAAVVVAVDNPAAMAAKWAEGLECELIDDMTMQCSGADQTVRFETIEANHGKSGVVGIDVYAGERVDHGFCPGYQPTHKQCPPPELLMTICWNF